MVELPDDMKAWTNLDLIRQWWYEYRQLLGRPGSESTERLTAIGRHLEERGAIPRGGRMPRAGAEDLADQCDEAKKRMWG